MTSTPPPKYRAQPGQEDRHGEMTGAITIRYVLVMPPVAVWCIFVGPWLMGTWPTVIVGVVLAVVLTMISGPLSRRIWSVISDYMDHSRF